MTRPKADMRVCVVCGRSRVVWRFAANGVCLVCESQDARKDKEWRLWRAKSPMPKERRQTLLDPPILVQLIEAEREHR